MEDIPVEIWKKIFQDSGWKTQIQLKCVCKSWRAIVRDNSPFTGDILNLASWWIGSLQKRILKQAVIDNNINVVKWILFTGFKNIDSAWGIAHALKREDIQRMFSLLKSHYNMYTFKKHLVRFNIDLSILNKGYTNELSYLTDLNIIRESLRRRLTILSRPRRE